MKVNLILSYRLQNGTEQVNSTVDGSHVCSECAQHEFQPRQRIRVVLVISLSLFTQMTVYTKPLFDALLVFLKNWA
jgi:hypothetical protein